jgi:hypothetical protein
MRSWFWQGTLAAVIALPALSTAAQAQSDGGCSNATLTGEYAFAVTAYTPPGLPNGPPQVVTGIKFFDGNGNLTQRDFIGDSFRTRGQTEFSTGETGTYEVRPDCTGSMVITVPVPGLSSGTIWIEFVISNGGRHIHEVVSKFIPPTPPGVPHTAQPTQTSADDWKVGLD